MQNVINYSKYSIGLGLLDYEDIVDNAILNNKNYAVITDQETFSGLSDFFIICNKKNVKPVVGVTINVTIQRKEKGSIVLYAKNLAGYSDLCQLLSLLPPDDNYKKRTVELRPILEKVKASDNLIVADGYEGSLLEEFKKDNKKIDYLKIVNFIKDKYLLIANENTENKDLIIETAKRFNIKIMLSNISRYKEDKDKLAFLSKLNKTSYIRDFSSDLILDSYKNNYSLKNNYQYNNDIPRELIIGQDVYFNDFENYDIFSSPSFPTLYEDRDLTNNIRNIWKNFKEKIPKDEHDKYIKRIKYELSVIKKIGLNIDQYFLFYEDLSHVAKEKNIMTLIRGSGTGSLLLYMMGLSDVDPIKFKLSFERFLNPDRASLADIDLEASDKEELDNYIKGKFGNTVAKLMTTSRVKKASSTMDIAINGYKRFIKNKKEDGEKNNIGWVEDTLKELSKYLKKKDDNNVSWLLENNYYWKKAVTESELFKKMCDVAMTLEYQIVNRTPSPSSFVLSNDDLRNKIPVINNIIEAEKVDSDDFGFVKNDLLSSKILERLQILTELISEGDPDFIKKMESRDDPLIFQNMSKGFTVGINQINGYIGTEICQEIKPSNFEDIIAVMALVREGVKNKTGEYERFLMCKKNKSKISYPTPEIKHIIEDTYGAIIYEEQIMEISRVMGGFDWNYADLLRSCLKKKDENKLKELGALFIEGSLKNGYSKEVVDVVYKRLADKINQFSFTRNHATAYASLTYNEMFIKTYYPAEFLEVNLKYLTKDKKQEFKERMTEEILVNGIAVLRPDINEVQELSYTSSKYVKNREYKLFIQNIDKCYSSKELYLNVLKIRDKHGFFDSLTDYLERVTPLYTGNNLINSNKNENGVLKLLKDTELLINIGAFDSIYEKKMELKDVSIIRETLKFNLERILKNIIHNNDLLSDDFYFDKLPTDILNNKDDLIKGYILAEKEILYISPLEILKTRENVKKEFNNNEDAKKKIVTKPKK